MPEERFAAVAATGRPVYRVPDADDVHGMLRHMRVDLGASVLLCEGGPTTNAQFYEAGVVDEYFVTIGPVIVGGKDTLTAVEGPRAFTRETAKRLELLSACANPVTSELYLRYRVRH